MVRNSPNAPKYRSGFEQRTAAWLKEHGIRFKYESMKLPYGQKAPRCVCVSCGSKAVVKNRSYTVDFFLPDFSFLVETKGRLTSAERTKFDALCSRYDIRLVFQRNNRISKTSKTTYAQWAETHGIKYSIGVPDIKWFGGKSGKQKKL